MGKATWWLVSVAAAAFFVATAVYFGLKAMRPEPQALAPGASPPTPSAAAGPQIRFPIQAEDKPLPPLEQSDRALEEAVADLFGEKSLAGFFNLPEFARRVVATVDNLPREKLALRLMPVKPVAGPFLAAGTDESAVISRENGARYAGYVRIVEAVDAKKAVALYVRFYPLFQQAYHELGYPQGYFNDRLIDVIDNLLAAPEPKEPVGLLRPKVFYQFADPALEALPAGQKILVRIGADNASKVKWKLRQIRGELVGQSPKQ